MTLAQRPTGENERRQPGRVEYQELPIRPLISHERGKAALEAREELFAGVHEEARESHAVCRLKGPARETPSSRGPDDVGDDQRDAEQSRASPQPERLEQDACDND